MRRMIGIVPSTLGKHLCPTWSLSLEIKLPPAPGPTSFWAEHQVSPPSLVRLGILPRRKLALPLRALCRCILDRAAHRLLLLVLGLQLPLHVKVELALALDALLLHVADDALVHGLETPVTTTQS